MKPAITAEELSKRYRLGSRPGGYRTLRESIAEASTRPLGLLRRLARPGDPGGRSGGKRFHWALRDVSFDVQRGEVVGIIGRNGAGKSTLLKILSRIAEPTSGRAVLRGQISSLLEVGTGFHPELTGRENIYLSGAILGMTRAEIARKFDEIVAFAELDWILDTPVKHYSSGMYVRLAFAVSAHLDPHILLIDEVLAVGDLAFQRKCMEHTGRLRDRDGTVLLVSHNMFSIKAACSRVIYLSEGRIDFDGPPDEAIARYEQDSCLDIPNWARTRIGDDPASRPIRITGVEIRDEDGRPRALFEHGERMRIRVRFHARERIDEPNFTLSLIRSDGIPCCNYNTAMDGFRTGVVSGDGEIELLTPSMKLVSELYTIQVLVWDPAFQHLHCAQVGATFQVRHELLSTHFGVFHEPARWSW